MQRGAPPQGVTRTRVWLSLLACWHRGHWMYLLSAKYDFQIVETRRCRYLPICPIHQLSVPKSAANGRFTSRRVSNLFSRFVQSN